MKEIKKWFSLLILSLLRFTLDWFDKVEGHLVLARFGGIIIKGEIKEMELREGQEVDVKLVLTTRSGRTAQHQEGSAVWESSNPDVATVTVDPTNELVAKIMGVNGEGNQAVVITARVDGDPDGEVREIVASGDVVVTQGEAFVGELRFASPVDIPAPESPTP